MRKLLAAILLVAVMASFVFFRHELRRGAVDLIPALIYGAIVLAVFVAIGFLLSGKQIGSRRS